MKARIAFAVTALFANSAVAGSLTCDTANLPPVRSALIGTLVPNGYLTYDEAAEFRDTAASGRKNEDITIKTLGRKLVGPIPWYSEFEPPLGPLPFDSPVGGDDLYQLVQYLRIKNKAGKIFEFMVIGSVANHDCDLSTPLVIEVSPQYRVVGSWEDYLQAWERMKNKGKEITPNLVK